jgi:hypothetical protein
VRLILGYRPSSGVHETILESSTTRRLSSMMPSWRDHFETRNLYSSSTPGSDDAVDAVALDAWIRNNDVSVIVTLGQSVSRELLWGMGRAPWLSWHRFTDDRWFLKFPHPSGRNRWYNDAGNVAAATRELRRAAARN